MSLSTNSAFAAIGQPADSQLTERADSPQTAPTKVKAEGGNGSITVMWTIASTDRRFRIRYTDGTVYSYVGPTTYASGNAGANCEPTADPADLECSHTISDLTNGVEHTVEVQSSLASGGFQRLRCGESNSQYSPRQVPPLLPKLRVALEK